ncbi:MAG: gfo/Idh/MocA family oxidoreductase [Acidobacteriota bacterium]|nr:MAG: gfo/Idh/MocA family oxidoreductase [Acidobacteriota bacterium]
MSEQSGKDTSRRGFLKGASRIATASALAAGLTPRVHAAGNDTIQVALVGCGGRGSGAAINALAVKNGPIKLVAMADVFEARLTSSYDSLIKAQAERKDPDTNEPVIGPDQIDVPEERKFIGFDAYKHAMDSLKPGDVVILATPPAFRWPHFKYAIDKELNVFMEKPVTVDGPTTRRILNLGELAGIRNLKVGVGLMCRHCDARKELFDRIQSGQIGDVEYLRAYRMHGPVGFFYSGPKPAEKTHLMYQVERFHSFLWASGGCYSDFYIHNIDECCWMKNGWPVKAQGMGWRHNRGDAIDQNFDGYSVEYSFEDGARLLLEGRCIEGCYNKFSSFAHGTKGSAVISISSHTPARSRILTGQDVHSETGVAWAYPEGEANPYQLEWNHLIQAIREDQPYNEVERGAMASLVTSMGRMAAHTGQEITLDQILNSDHEFAPDVDKFDGPDFEAPLQPDENGLYPLPNPGVKKDREY